MPPYSIDLRRKVIAQLAEGYSVRQVAKNFGIHFTTVQQWKTRDCLEPTKRTSYPAKIDLKALMADVEQYPDAYQYERAKRFHCSQADIGKALKKLGISYKKNTQPSQSESR